MSTATPTNRAHELIIEIQALEIDLHEVSQELDHLRDNSALVVAEITAEVTCECGPDGKPLYSNEHKRKAAITARLCADGRYEKLNDLVRDTERKKVEMKAQLDAFTRAYSLARIDYEYQRLGRRDER